MHYTTRRLAALAIVPIALALLYTLQAAGLLGAADLRVLLLNGPTGALGGLALAFASRLTLLRSLALAVGCAAINYGSGHASLALARVLGGTGLPWLLGPGAVGILSAALMLWLTNRLAARRTDTRAILVVSAGAIVALASLAVLRALSGGLAGWQVGVYFTLWFAAVCAAHLLSPVREGPGQP